MQISLQAVLLTLFLSVPILLFSQKAPKYGSISDEEKSITETPLDPEANAIILADYCETSFNGGNVDIIRHTRIKILNKNGLEHANVAIPYYAFDKIEKFITIKAHTINIDEKGKVVKTKIKKSEFFKVDLNDKWKEMRFAFPNVKPGSIIEYEYSKDSKSVVSLEAWNFQNELPTLSSMIKVNIGAGLDYRIVYNGSRLIKKYGDAGSKNKWDLQNIPPLKDEVYCMNPEDYVESIKFQLAGYKTSDGFGGSKYVELMSTWPNLAKDILDDDDYKKILKSKKSANKIIESLISEDDSRRDKIKKIYTYVQKNLEWNEQFRLYPKQSFDEIFESKTANSAEINLCLVKLLQSAGFEANPVIISTKGHGLITKVYPLYSQFNHVIVQVTLNKQDLLMDAVSKIRPYNLLSKHDLNPLGYLLSRDNSRWIEIPFPQRTKTVMVNELKFKDNQIKNKIIFSFYEHEAVRYRSLYAQEKMEDSFVTKYLLKTAEENDMELDSFSVKNPFKLDKPFFVVCHFTKELDESLGSDIIYINPFLNKHYEKNPFTNSVRYLPVDFILPSVEKLVTNIYPPDGYELEEKFDNTKLVLPEEKITYSLLFNQPYSGMIQISSEFVITQPLIKPEEYENLRDLFNKMIGFQDINVVLKKK